MIVNKERNSTCDVHIEYHVNWSYPMYAMVTDAMKKLNLLPINKKSHRSLIDSPES